jgi:hypothetical protein
MTEDEQKLLRTASEAIMQLVRDRDDMVAGLTAVFLDLYRVEFQEGRQAKAEVLVRLQIQRDRLAQHSARQIGVMFLDSLIQTVEKAQLQPAKPPGGRQLQLRDGSLRSAETQLPITAAPRVNPPGRLLGRFTKGDRTAYAAAEITMLRQKPAAAEGRIQGIGRHNATEAALDVLRDRMEALRRDQNALRERMAALFSDETNELGRWRGPIEG